MLSCGNGVLETHEQCEFSTSFHDRLCDNNCQCKKDYAPLGPYDNCILIKCDSEHCCGDGVLGGAEECDVTFVNDRHCTHQCKCKVPFVPDAEGNCVTKVRSDDTSLNQSLLQMRRRKKKRFKDTQQQRRMSHMPTQL